MGLEDHKYVHVFEVYSCALMSMHKWYVPIQTYGTGTLAMAVKFLARGIVVASLLEVLQMYMPSSPS